VGVQKEKILVSKKERREPFLFAIRDHFLSK
jgi:hypothetical protein